MDESFLQYGCGCEHGQYGGCGCAALSAVNKPPAKRRYGGYAATAIPRKRAASRAADDALAHWLLPKKRLRTASPKRSRSAAVDNVLKTSRKRSPSPQRRSPPDETARTRYRPSAAKNRAYFLRPDRMTDAEKKYCRCLADVGSKQGSSCLRSAGSRSSARGKGCANPYAICGHLKPKSLGSRGCAMFYNYKTMPYAQSRATADIHNKTIKELIDAARDEAERMKWS